MRRPSRASGKRSPCILARADHSDAGGVRLENQIQPPPLLHHPRLPNRAPRHSLPVTSWVCYCLPLELWHATQSRTKYHSNMENTEATSVSLLREIIDVNNNKATNLIETQYVASDDPFGQGDIIQLLERPRPPHFGVVINADCDLLHRKTDGVCSYLPIYSFHEYLFEFWIDRFLETQKQQIVAQIANTIKQPNSENDALKQWLESDDFASLPDRLTAEFELNTKTKSILSKQVTRYINFLFQSRLYGTIRHLMPCSKRPHQLRRFELSSATA